MTHFEEVEFESPLEKQPDGGRGFGDFVANEVNRCYPHRNRSLDNRKRNLETLDVD